ncbi:MAG: SAM-dependent methyltransferase [Pseudomonadota bacterium]
MTSPPVLFDRKALGLRRARAAVRPADFLHEAVVAEVKERLAEVNKSFTAPAIVTGRPSLWQLAFPDAKITPDDDVLDLSRDGHDLVIHSLALHWANDPVGQLVQCRRALRPDGLFVGVLFGGQTLHELRTSLAETEAAVMNGLSPRVAPMGEIRDLGALLQRAGFALPVADAAPVTASYASALHVMRDLRAMGETNVMMGRDRRTPPRRFFAEVAAHYATHFPAEDGRVRATFDLVYLTGWAPSDTQQKPLRPGSAQARLADALGTREHGTGEKPGDGPD